MYEVRYWGEPIQSYMCKKGSYNSFAYGYPTNLLQCPDRTAFVFTGLMLSCLGTATYMYWCMKLGTRGLYQPIQCIGTCIRLGLCKVSKEQVWIVADITHHLIERKYIEIPSRCTRSIKCMA